MIIYIGNFSYYVTDIDLKDAFQVYGAVNSVMIIKDQPSGESRGFGFVEMLNKLEAETAIKGVKEIKGKVITIREAKPRQPVYRSREFDRSDDDH